MKFKSIIIIILISNIISEPEEDLVKDLPDYPFEKKMYSGYLNITEIKKLHYIYLESENDSDKLFIWFNGGPFCSSLNGWSKGHGPFVIEGNKFVKNPYSWNKLANMLYIESPAGAGFSILNSTKEEDFKTNDNITAKENLIGLIDFYNKFPSLKNKKLYISGESYAGIYIPMLAYEILNYNDKISDDKDKINLKGIMIGNAYTDKKYEEYYAIVDYAFSHGLLSYEIRKDFLQNCINEFNKALCMDNLNKTFLILEKLNIYDYLRDKDDDILSSENNNFYFNYERWRFPKNLQSKQKNFLQELNNEKFISRSSFTTNYQKEYLNKIEVKKALHVKESINWESCSELYYYYDQENEGSIIYYPYLLGKIKILIYSGDTDIIVPINGSLNWIRNLKLKIIDKWQSWKGKNLNGTEEDNKISGFRMKYEGLSFVSFKGIGHMVVEWDRKNSLYMIDQFLKDEF